MSDFIMDFCGAKSGNGIIQKRARQKDPIAELDSRADRNNVEHFAYKHGGSKRAVGNGVCQWNVHVRGGFEK